MYVMDEALQFIDLKGWPKGYNLNNQTIEAMMHRLRELKEMVAVTITPHQTIENEINESTIYFWKVQ